MVIDESSARAAIKKQIKIYYRRLQMSCVQEKPNWKMAKSRKMWSRDIIKHLKKVSLVLEVIKEDSCHYRIFFLNPEKQRFKLNILKLNSRTFSINIQTTELVLTNHFIIRLMQSRKTLRMDGLVNDLRKIVFIILPFLFKPRCEEYIADMGIYVDRLGYIALSFLGSQEKTGIYIKTVIPPQVMGIKHRSQYEHIEGSGCYSLAAATQPTKYQAIRWLNSNKISFKEKII